jgi:hypothetical protein
MADALSTTLDDQVDDGTVVTEFTVVNEFAAVRVRKLLTRNGERLRVDSLRLGYRNRLDALALEALSWQPPETISEWLTTPFGPSSSTTHDGTER